MPRKNLLVVAALLVLSVACGGGDDTAPSTVPSAAPSETAAPVGEDDSTSPSDQGPVSGPDGETEAVATTIAGEESPGDAGTVATTAGAGTEPDGGGGTTTTGAQDGTTESTDTAGTGDTSP